MANPPAIRNDSRSSIARRDVRIPFTCSMSGVPFVGIARNEGDRYVLYDSDIPRGGSEGKGSPYRLEMRLDTDWGWNCPVCSHGGGGNGSIFWQCQCGPYLMCSGDLDGYCACGQRAYRKMRHTDTFMVPAAPRSVTEKVSVTRTTTTTTTTTETFTTDRDVKW